MGDSSSEQAGELPLSLGCLALLRLSREFVCFGVGGRLEANQALHFDLGDFGHDFDFDGFLADGGLDYAWVLFVDQFAFDEERGSFLGL